MDEDTIIIGFEDTEDDNFPIGAGKGYVRASTSSFWKYERLPELNGVLQTKVTWCQQADLKGLIPSFVVNSRIVQTLQYLSKMRAKFDKSLEFDRSRRAELVKLISQEEVKSGEDAVQQFEAIYFAEKKG